MDALKDRAAAGGLWNPKGTEACGFPRVRWWHRKDLTGTEQVAVARMGREAWSEFCVCTAWEGLDREM